MWDKPQQLNRLSNLLLMIALGLLVWIVWGLLAQSKWFPVKEVQVTGVLEHVTKAQVQLVVDKTVGGNILSADLVAMQQAFESMPWVESVIVKRRYPKRLVVEMQEHQPIARWGSNALLSSKGKLFHAIVDEPLPALFGPEHTERLLLKQYAALAQPLHEAGLGITKLTLSDRFAWEVETVKGLTIAIGRTEKAVNQIEQVASRVQRFVNVYQQTAGEWSEAIEYVDLRYQDGFAVRRPVIEVKG